MRPPGANAGSGQSCSRHSTTTLPTTSAAGLMKRLRSMWTTTNAESPGRKWTHSNHETTTGVRPMYRTYYTIDVQRPGFDGKPCWFNHDHSEHESTARRKADQLLTRWY